MLDSFDTLRIIRENMISLTSSLSLDQMTVIPAGFNNNMIWNMGHALATQHVLVYQLSGIPIPLDQTFVDRYRKGSFPQSTYQYQSDLAYINEHFNSSVDRMAQDFQNEIFQSFQEYQTSFGVKLTSAEEAITFNNMHESLHLGYMMSMKHCIL